MGLEECLQIRGRRRGGDRTDVELRGVFGGALRGEEDCLASLRGPHRMTMRYESGPAVPIPV
ncbi:hypothetical protein GCM10010461_13690 [Microbacterium aurantiacum]